MSEFGINKKDLVCVHGIDLSVRCIRCESDKRKKKKEDEARKEALDRIMERAKNLNW